MGEYTVRICVCVCVCGTMYQYHKYIGIISFKLHAHVQRMII